MKIRFCCDSGANLHSCKEEIIDLKAEYDITNEEWNEMEEKQKLEIVTTWAWEGGLDIFFEEA